MAAVSLPVFGHSDVLMNSLQFMSPRDICNVSFVCKPWQEHFKTQKVFEKLHEAAKFPEFEGGNFNARNFLVLVSTVGGDPKALYRKYLGEPNGKTASVSKFQIEELKKPDPDAPGQKKYETHSAVFLYPSVNRPIREGEYVIRDGGSILILKQTAPFAPSKVKEIEVGISMHNAIELFRNPLDGEKNGPVFQFIIFPSIPAHFLQFFLDCVSAPSVEFVRREIPKDSFSKTGEEQTNRLPNTQIAGLLPQIFRCGFDILETKSCAYAQLPSGRVTHARSRETFQGDGRPGHFNLGQFEPGKGVKITYASSQGNPGISTVPCIPAQPIALESMDIDTSIG